jgi:hypothetical protein
MSLTLLATLLLASPSPATVAPLGRLPTLGTIRAEVPGELSFVGIFAARTTVTNIVPTSPLLNDQLVGRLLGPYATTDDSAHAFTEQRAIGFLDYSPLLLGGRAHLKAGFEVDFTYGDTANTAGANRGGAINGDTVNLQTKRLLADIELSEGLRLVVGLQPLSDSAYDPTRALPSTLMHGGGHLLFWGTDAAGINLYGRWGAHAARVGVFELYSNSALDEDGVTLLMADWALPVAWATEIGLHAWHLVDYAGRQGPTLLGIGPGSQLADGNGAAPLTLGPEVQGYDLHLTWLGADVSLNRWLQGDRFSLSAAAFVNIGQFTLEARPGSEITQATPSLLGVLLDAELGWRWGRTDGDALTLEGLYVSGDDTPGDGVLSSPVTGNVYGTPGALHVSHRSLLLFADPRAVNRHVGLVYDPANLGYGVMAAFLNGSTDLVPHRLNLKLGLAMAGAAAQPKGGDRFIGVEGNVELMYRPMAFLWFGAHAAKARLGTFLEGRVSERPLPAGNPWVSYLSVTWVAL